MAKPDKEIPYCTIFLVFGAITCHALVFCGNLATSRTMRLLGESTNGWSGVGIDLADSMANELDDLMSRTTSILTQSIGAVQNFSNGLDTAMSISGSITDGILELYTPSPSPVASPALLLQEKVKALHMPKDAKLSAIQGNASRAGAKQKVAGAPRRATPAEKTQLMTAHRRQKGRLVQPTAPGSTQIERVIDGIFQNISDRLGVNISEDGTMVMPSPQELRPYLVDAISSSVSGTLARVTPLLRQFFQLVRPALLQIGRWLTSMGERIQAVIETFSTTLDRVQKIIDQLMSQMSTTAGYGEEQMLYDTYTLFDASNTGFITAEDLSDVADMYSISALQGQVASELFERYDSDHDGRIYESEFALLVHDEGIPGAMAMVLRTYARRMSVISGNVAAARLRDEVASAVVGYLTLVCSKNMTKVGWVSQALTNQSVPIQFTADILKQLAEQDDNPVQLTTADVGSIIINEMSRLNGPYVGEVLHLMGQPAFWVSEGFDLNQQAAYVERVVRWVTEANNSRQVIANVPELASHASDGGNLSSTLPAVARQASEARILAYQQSGAAPPNNYASAASQELQSQLLGGAAAGEAGSDPAQQRAANAGVPARPETLLFAARLASNSSATAARFQAQAMNYSGTSSDALDNFANQVQNMLQRVQSFLHTMEEYSTPTGIQRMEELVTGFAENAATDIANTLVNFIDRELETRMPGAFLGQPPAPIAAISGVFVTLNNIMTSFQTILPGVVDDLKFARRQVSAVANTLNNTFTTFQDQGPPVFNTISELYSTIWTAYFAFFTSLTALVLFYGFWASGWFGGPANTSVEAYEPPQTFRDRCRVCCASCSACMKACHDSSLCFWSIALLMEVIVLVLFLVSIVLCLLAGVKAFLSAGCAQVYILNDDLICTGTLGNLRQWLSSFMASGGVPIEGICDARQLRTCHLIGSQMQTSAILTVIGSLLAAVLSFQMIIESAIMHERARWRRMFDEESKKV